MTRNVEDGNIHELEISEMDSREPPSKQNLIIYRSNQRLWWFFSTRLDMFKSIWSLGGAVLLLAESMSVFSFSVLLLRNNLEKDFPEYSINKIDLYL